MTTEKTVCEFPYCTCENSVQAFPGLTDQLAPIHAHGGPGALAKFLAESIQEKGTAGDALEYHAHIAYYAMHHCGVAEDVQYMVFLGGCFQLAVPDGQREYLKRVLERSMEMLCEADAYVLNHRLNKVRKTLLEKGSVPDGVHTVEGAINHFIEGKKTQQLSVRPLTGSALGGVLKSFGVSMDELNEPPVVPAKPSLH
jgi:hypothetical protein